MSSSPPARSWVVRKATPKDRDATLVLKQRAFGRDEIPLDAARRWDWLFLENPSGTSMHYLIADASGRLAGQYSVVPMRMQHAGRRTLGLLSLDTVTDPDFMRQGILTTLAKQL